MAPKRTAKEQPRRSGRLRDKRAKAAQLPAFRPPRRTTRYVDQATPQQIARPLTLGIRSRDASEQKMPQHIASGGPAGLKGSDGARPSSSADSEESDLLWLDGYFSDGCFTESPQLLRPEPVSMALAPTTARHPSDYALQSCPGAPLLSFTGLDTRIGKVPAAYGHLGADAPIGHAAGALVIARPQSASSAWTEGFFGPSRPYDTPFGSSNRFPTLNPGGKSGDVVLPRSSVEERQSLRWWGGCDDFVGVYPTGSCRIRDLLN